MPHPSSATSALTASPRLIATLAAPAVLSLRPARAATWPAAGPIRLVVASAAGGNAVLAETFERLNARVKRVRYAANLGRARWDKAIAEHDEMIAALSARDGRALRAILEAHLAGKRESVLAAFAAEQSAEAYD
jgi:hypothetical protein